MCVMTWSGQMWPQLIIHLPSQFGPQPPSPLLTTKPTDKNSTKVKHSSDLGVNPPLIPLSIIPSQMGVKHRNVALLDPQRTNRTQTLKEHLETRKFREKKKRDQGSSGVCRAGGTNVGLRAFGAQAVMLRYVVLRLLTTKCYKKPKFATKKCCKIAKISHK